MSLNMQVLSEPNSLFEFQRGFKFEFLRTILFLENRKSFLIVSFINLVYLSGKVSQLISKTSRKHYFMLICLLLVYFFYYYTSNGSIISGFVLILTS